MLILSCCFSTLADDKQNSEDNTREKDYVIMYPLPLEKEWQMTSTRAGGNTTIRFVNRSDRPLKVFFLDLNGKRQTPDDVPPNGSLIKPTQVAHAWVVTDAQGKAEAIFVGEQKPGMAIVGKPVESKQPLTEPSERVKPLPVDLEKTQPPIIAISPPQQDFYSKMLDYDGILIKAHQDVSDKAMREAYRRMSVIMEKQPNVHWNLKMAGSELHIIGRDQVTSDLPEYRRMKGRPFDGNLTVDQRTRGMGGLIASCGEENLLRLDSDRYRGRDICVHEFGHNIFSSGLPTSVRDLFIKQRTDSLKNGHWVGAYAGSNPDEYFAELTMWYWGYRGEMSMAGPKPEDGRDGLKQYDPEAFALMDDFYSGRINVPKIEYVDLQPLGPEKESTTKSDKSGERTSIRFVNHGNKPLEIFWLDAEGQRKSSGKLPPYGSLSKRTQAGHAWIVADEQGKCVAIYIADSKRGVAEISQ